MATSDGDNSRDNSPSLLSERPKLQTSLVGAFVAGVAVANFNKNLLLGFVIGALAGTYVEQTFPGQFPSVRQFWFDIKQKWKDSRANNN